EHHRADMLMPFSGQFAGDHAALPVLQVTRDVANAWLRRGGATDLGVLQQQIDKAVKPASVALDRVQVRGEVALKRTEKQVKNVLAMLPGQGPHADEYVVIGAHYDHLGHGGPGSLAFGSKAIHHG